MNHFDGEYMSSDYTIGFDIEFPIQNTNGNFVSAIPFIDGTKDSPYYVKGGNLQRDNIALEIAIEYAYNLEELIQNTRNTLQAAIKRLPKGYSISCIPSCLFPSKELQHPEAREAGCSPDYNAITGNANDVSLADTNLRSFGLHVHTGGVPLENNKIHVIASDLVLGLFSTMHDNTEAAIQRRTLYGKPSCYRDKPYGVEYRTLSNFWCSSPRLITMIYYLNNIVPYIATYRRDILFEQSDIIEVSDIITEGDDVRATEIFFELIYSKLSFKFKKLITDELNYTSYESIVNEWMLDTSKQNRTVADCTRDNFNPKEGKEIRL